MVPVDSTSTVLPIELNTADIMDISAFSKKDSRQSKRVDLSGKLQANKMETKKQLSFSHPGALFGVAESPTTLELKDLANYDKDVEPATCKA